MYIHCPCGREARETFTSVCLHVRERVCPCVCACKDDRWQGSYNLERQTRVCMAWRAARPSNKGKSKRNDKRQTLKHPHSSPPPPSATAPLFLYPTTSHPNPFLSYITRPTLKRRREKAEELFHVLSFVLTLFLRSKFAPVSFIFAVMHFFVWQ